MGDHPPPYPPKPIQAAIEAAEAIPMGSELLLEAVRAFLRRRLRRRLCNSHSWTGGTLGFIVADCAFVSEPGRESWAGAANAVASNVKAAPEEPYAWMVYALASFLDDAPRSTRSTPRGATAASNAPKMGNWITQAFGVLTHSTGARPVSHSLRDAIDRDGENSNWISSTFFDMARPISASFQDSGESTQRQEANWITSAFRALAPGALVHWEESSQPSHGGISGGWISESLLEATREM
eukprot:s52_g8.t1